MNAPDHDLLKFTDKISESELKSPSPLTVFRLIWFSVRDFFKERHGQIICSTFLVVILWGTHGRMEWLSLIWPDWRGPGVDIGSRPVLIPGVPWDNELISFWAGAFLWVIIPMFLIKFLFRQPLSDYGLGLPPPGKRMLAFWSFMLLLAISAVPFWLGSSDPSMCKEYPIYKPITGFGRFAAYELTYLPFFIAIEFMFRGYLLFGLAGAASTDKGEARGRKIFFGKYALVIAMLPYIAWHLGKPVPEVWGTIVWGFAAGIIAYTIRSIWPVVAAHWMLNVFLDALITKPF